MNTDLARLIGSLRLTLSDAVAPELQTDFARGQLAAVHDILGKLAGMVVWDPQALAEQALALQAGARHFAEQAAAWGLAPPAGPAARDASLPAAEAHMRALADWLDAATPSLPPEQAGALDTVLRQALREQLRVERKRIPLTDFNAMTAATQKD